MSATTVSLLKYTFFGVSVSVPVDVWLFALALPSVVSATAVSSFPKPLFVPRAESLAVG